MSKPFEEYLLCVRGIYDRILEIDDIFIKEGQLKINYGTGMYGIIYSSYGGENYEIQEAYDFFDELIND